MAPRAALAAVVAVALQATESLGCTIVAVGAEASASGYPLVAHTDDSGSSTTDIRFVRVPRKKWPKGSKRPLHQWQDGYPRVVSSSRSPEYAPAHGQKETEPIGYIPQVPETYGYWDMDYGVQNEKGLAIGESTTTARTVGWPAGPDRPWGYCRAGIEDLSKIALERCETARCAVQTMGDVAVEMGFFSADSGEPSSPDYADSAEALAVADTKELWIFNVITGANNASAIWAAMRIPPDHVAAVGNSITIRKMNLSDPENFLYSPGVTKLAEEKGWWNPKDDAPGIFDFFGAYGFTPPKNGNATHDEQAALLENVLAFYSGRRMWRIFNLLSPEEGAKLDPNKGNLPHTVDPYPSSVPAPKGSISARTVMSVLRDHYEGTPYDLTAGMAAGPFGNPNRGPVVPRGTPGQWERAISMHRSSWSYIIEAKPAGRGVTWLGYDSPHGTAYLPFFAANGPAPDSFHSHEGYMAKFSTKVAWWAFNLIDQYTDINFQLINQDVRNHSHKIEDEAEELVAKCDAKAAKAEKHGGEEAVSKLLTACSNEFAEAKVAQWWDLAWSLFAKYGRYTITFNESEVGERLQVYPQWWVNSAEVGYTLWRRDGPFHGIPDEAPLPLALAAEVREAASPGFLALALLTVAGLAVVAGYQAAYQAGLRRGLHMGKNDQDYYVAQP